MSCQGEVVMENAKRQEGQHLSAFCPVFHHAIELIGRRWTGAILRAMLSGAGRFTEIGAAVPGLSDRLLSERLKELEAEGIVTRVVVPSTPVRVDYMLTPKGEDLHHVICAVATWAATWETNKNLTDVSSAEMASRRDVPCYTVEQSGFPAGEKEGT